MKRKNLLSTKKNKLTALFVMLMVLALLAGCARSKDNAAEMEDSYYGDMNAGDSLKDEMADMENGVSSSTTTGSDAIKDNRKLIKKYFINAETKEFDTTLDTIYAKINELGGYIENSEISGNSYNYDRSRYADLVIRIPADKMTVFVDKVKEAGNVTNYSEEVTDITLDYVDTQSHIEALEVERDTLMEMLEQSGDLETLLTIQNELTNVRYELEFYESAIRTYDQQVSFGTITLYLQEVIEITEQIGEETFFEELSRKFADSVEAMVDMVKNLVIALVCILPFLLPVAIILAIIIAVVMIFDKRRRKKIIMKNAHKATEEGANSDRK